MADREIAEYMNMARRTVNTRRQKAYRLLKEPIGRRAMIPFQAHRIGPYDGGAKDAGPQIRYGSLKATTHGQDNETPALNALKALRGAPTSMGRGEIPVEPSQRPSVFCLF